MNKPWLLSRSVKHLLRIAAVGSWGALAVLSLLVSHSRPHTGAYALAYFLSAFVTRLGIQNTESRWQLVAFSSAAAFFEVCQIWIPGQSPELDNWAASLAGALAGIVIARSAVHFAEERRSRVGAKARPQ